MSLKGVCNLKFVLMMVSGDVYTHIISYKNYSCNKIANLSLETNRKKILSIQ